MSSHPLAWVHLNGALVPAAEAVLPATGRGALYGESLFETMRAYRGTVFRLDCHVQRLMDAAVRLGLPLTGPGGQVWNAAGLMAAVQETVGQATAGQATVGRNPEDRPVGDRVPDLRVRLTLWGRTSAASDLAVLVYGYQPLGEARWAQGYRAVTAGARVDPRSPLAGLKTGNYLPLLMAWQQAVQAGADEALLHTVDGRLAEGSRSTVFLVKDGRIVTPDLPGTGILPGITRALVLELARTEGLAVEERAVGPQELGTADEAFLTNSLVELVPLTMVDGEAIHHGMPGPVTRRLAGVYQARVSQEIRGG